MRKTHDPAHRSSLISDHITNLKSVKEFCTFSNEPFFRLACDYYRPGTNVLDVGAGKGGFAHILNDPSIYLLDGNPDSFRYLKSRYQNAFLHNLPDPLPFEDSFFDMIHCSHIIEHLSSQDLYDSLSEFNRCLSPGGHLVVSTPLLYSGFYDDLSHTRPYSPWTLLHYLENPGLDNRSRRVISTEYEVVRLQYRYTITPIPYINISHAHTWLQEFLIRFVNILRRINFGYYEKTGYTLVLRKKPAATT